jgi:hypothetical protein
MGPHIRLLLLALTIACTEKEEETEAGTCTSGDLQCDGDTLQACTEGAWENAQDCAAEGMICHEEMGHCMEAETSDGGADGGGTDAGADGASDGGGETGAPTCTEEEVRCEGTLLQTCTDGAWVTEEDCAERGLECMEAHGHCM